MTITREDIVAELRNAALIAALAKPQRPEPPTGSDGEETSRSCAEKIREHKLADQMRRERAFSAGEVEVARYYSQTVASALSRGEQRARVWSEETTRLTGQSSATATRFHKAMRTYQNDPEIAASLAFHVEVVTDEHGKDHIELVANVETDEPAERTTAAILLPLTRLKRPDDRAPHGGARDACPKCQSPMTRTTYDVCQNDACGHLVTHPSKTVGKPPFHDETDSPPVEIGGGLYAVEVRGEGPFHDEMKRERTYSKQDETVLDSLGSRPFHDETASRRPISFVSRDDLAWADDPHYWGESPPDDPPDPPAWQPPPLAPRSHIARGFQRQRPPTVNRTFTPSAEWQEVPDGYPCPPGGEFRMDFRTGKNWARWPEMATAGGGS